MTHTRFDATMDAAQRADDQDRARLYGWAGAIVTATREDTARRRASAALTAGVHPREVALALSDWLRGTR